MTARRPFTVLLKATTMAGLGLLMVCGFLILLGQLATPTAAAPLYTPVSCLINIPTTLTVTNSPYTINCAVNVQAPLTIDPGVVISSDVNGRLIIQSSGQLLANGTPAQPITFTAASTECAWLGIELQSDGNQIRHVFFDHAKYAIKIEVGSDANIIEANTFQHNGGCAADPLSGAIVGSTDDSLIRSNVFTDNNTAIYLSKSGGNIVAGNVISKTDHVALAFFPALSTRSSDNIVISNTVRLAGGFGISMTVGDNNSVLENKVYNNASGIGLSDQDTSTGNRVTVRNNDVYSNNGPGLYITDTMNLDVGENLIFGNSAGVLWDLNNDIPGAVITRNVICRNTNYLFRNNAASTVTAAPNWWGTNTPTVGSPPAQIQGPVTIDPRMILAATPALTTLPATGSSTTPLTVVLQGGGETVPLRARAITLTTSLGTISPTVVTLNGSGVAAATYTAANTPGTAVVTATDICAFLVTRTLTLTSVYDLVVTKTTALTWAVPGQTVTYTIVYSNASDYLAPGVVISDVLPAFTTFITDNSGLTRTGSGSGPIFWTVGDVLSHTGRTFVMTTTLSSGATCNNSITNTVSIGGSGGEPNLANNSAAVSLQILCGVNLIVVKNDGVGAGDPRPNVAAGDYITYTISVNNQGNQLAANVILSDTLPANTTFEAGRSTPGWTVASGGVYTINLGNLNSNGGTVLLFVTRVDPNLPCPITQTVNTAVASSNGPEIYPPDNTSHEQTPIICHDEPDLSKDDAIACAVPGQLIDYTISVTNATASVLNNLFLTEFLPANTSFQGPAGLWTPAGGNTFTHTVGPINNGQTIPTGFSVRVNNPITATAITNVVTLNPGSLSFTLTTPISTNVPDLYVVKNDNIEMLNSAAAATIARLEQKLGPLPWLEAVKGADIGTQATSAKPGDVISYSIAFGNAGPALATNVVITEILPANTTFVGPAYWTALNANTYVYTASSLSPGSGGILDFRVRVDSPFPSGTIGVTNTVRIAGTAAAECDTSNNVSIEFTRIGSSVILSTSLYLPIILKDFPPPTDSDDPDPIPTPLAYVSDVKADPDTNQVFVASPRHDWVYVINGSSDTVARNVPVGHGPTGLTVLNASVATNNKVFVAHQYGANSFHPGFMAFKVNETSAHNTTDSGYAGAAPIKTAANPANNSRVYVSNYFDKLAVFDGNSGPPEHRLGWVVQKAFQGAYGIDTSSVSNRVYLATRDTGELVVFDGNNDRLLQSNYIPTHIKPPQACTLWSVAVNEATGHIFVPCPQLGKVYVLAENQISVLDLETLGVLEKRDGYLALVVSAASAPWIAEITVPSGVNVGEEGIAVNATTGLVFITNARNNTLVILQDGASPVYLTTSVVGATPQGVDVNPVTQKVYVGNTGSNTVSVLNAAPPFSLIKTISLAP